MPLRETPRSLRLYSLLIGAVLLYSGAHIILHTPPGPASLHAVPSLLFGTAYLYICARNESLLRQRPGFIHGWLIASQAVSTLAMICTLLSGLGRPAWTGYTVGLAVAVYLYANVSRLSRKLNSPSPIIPCPTSAALRQLTPGGPMPSQTDSLP